MLLGDVVKSFPETAYIMMRYGLHCVGCHVATHETIEQGAKAHGLSEKEIEKMVKEMNSLIQKKE
ncbi:DUF1858 domain-containing protein [Candidatus Woesearchaeota archaeon]|nr:DUF1858 domain-containing protein [Candidatus Woesearchaeota archaeon]